MGGVITNAMFFYVYMYFLHALEWNVLHLYSKRAFPKENNITNLAIATHPLGHQPRAMTLDLMKGNSKSIPLTQVDVLPQCTR